MNKEEILLKLNKILIEMLEDESIIITEASTTNDVKGWDSITKMAFIGEVEQEFNIKLTTKDIFSLSNFGAFADTIMEKLK